MGQVVNLKNKTRRMLTVELEHPQAPRRRHVHHQRARDKKGKVGVKTQRLGIHDAVFLPGEAEIFCLPVYVADTPDAKRLEAADKLEIVLMEEAEAVKLKNAAEAKAKKEAEAKSKAAKVKADKRRKLSEALAAKRLAAPAPKAAKRNGNGKKAAAKGKE
jgi:hypothetical protein